MLDIALKEWSCVCDLLVEGRVGLLLRKGGVHEDAGPGRFRLGYRRFGLFPAWEHERLEWIKPALRTEFGERGVGGSGKAGQAVAHTDGGPDGDPAEICFRGFAEVAGVWEVPSRAAFDELDDLHPWLPPQIDMRFDYKPDRPLYVVLVRAYRLKKPKTVPNHQAFAGCRSWVPLQGGNRLAMEPAQPAVSEATLSAWQARVTAALGSGGNG
ncbi:MAG: DUF1802 family protein [Planctomycetota bacterium]